MCFVITYWLNLHNMPAGVYPKTEEHRLKISETLKRLKIRPPSSLGRKASIETRSKISEAHSGEKHPMFGKHHSDDSKNKMSKIKKGKTSPVLGMHWKIKDTSKMSEAHKGSKSTFWKGGKMKEYPENERIRKSVEIKLWRKSCMERDRFTCGCCKDNKGGNLEVHHINNFADFPELRTSIENGITFCKSCHKEFHKIYGKRNNSREQLKEFLNK